VDKNGSRVGDQATQQSKVVSTQELASLLGVGERHVQKLEGKGVLEKLGTGKWDLAACVQRYIAYRISSAAKNVEGDDDELDRKTREERLRKLIAEANIRERQAALQAANLFKAEDIMRVLGSRLVALRTKALALPAKLGPILLGQQDISFVVGRLEDEIHAFLTEVAVFTKEDFRAQEIEQLPEEKQQQDKEKEGEADGDCD
jgi:phage terminase Nu1 subunit (DNA packaging protein)